MDGHNKWFIAGVCALAVSVGFVVGTSQSPVGGVAITGGLGLAVVIFGVVKEGGAAAKGYWLGLVGQALCGFAPCLVAGIFVGAMLRGWRLHPKENPPVALNLPWGAANDVPTSAEEAVDWMVLQDGLLRMGYTQEQVKQAYGFAHRNVAIVPGATYKPLSTLLPAPPAASSPAGTKKIPDIPPVVSASLVMGG